MNKKCALLLSLFFITSAHAMENTYAKFFGGVNFLQNSENSSSYHTGYIIAGSLGYTTCYGVSLEAEYAFRRNTIKHIHFANEGSSNHGHLQTSSVMANVLWDLCEWRNFHPFIGAGLGYDFQRIHSSNSRIVFDQKWHHFSWQIIAGLAYPILCKTDLTLEYKFHQGGCDFNNHSLGIGIIYKFGDL